MILVQKYNKLFALFYLTAYSASVAAAEEVQQRRLRAGRAMQEAPAPAPNDTLENQVLCGYQGWFAYPGDGAPINKWKHWFKSSTDPSLDTLTVDMYPHMDEYNDEDMMESNLLMKDGSKAKFYSPVRPNIVKKHFEWMQDYGISGALQFMQDIHLWKNHDWKTSVLRNVKNAAEATGRVFAVSYDIAGTDDTVLEDLKKDWMKLVDLERITKSDRYLRHNGLPVLHIYKIGFKESNVADTAKIAELIDWLQNASGPEEKYRVFLMGGIPAYWRDRIRDSREEIEWKSIYDSLDAIVPWHVGRHNSINRFKDMYNNVIQQDARYCKRRGILYMPVMWPGFSWHNLEISLLGSIFQAPTRPNDPVEWKASEETLALPPANVTNSSAETCFFKSSKELRTVACGKYDRRRDFFHPLLDTTSVFATLSG